MIEEQERLAQAIAFAAVAHQGQFRWGGEPYITHPLRVMDSMEDHGESYQIVAVLHDVLEDTEAEINVDTLVYSGDWTMIFKLTPEEAVALGAITRASVDDSYEDYIGRLIDSSEMACMVKQADLEHNLVDAVEGSKFQVGYLAAYERIKDALNETAV